MGDEYTGGILEPLAKLFLKALKCQDDSKAHDLIYEWNDYVGYLNKVFWSDILR